MASGSVKKRCLCARGVFCSRSQVGKKYKEVCFYACMCLCGRDGEKKKGTKQEREWEAENERERLSGTKTTLAETA